MSDENEELMDAPIADAPMADSLIADHDAPIAAAPIAAAPIGAHAVLDGRRDLEEKTPDTPPWSPSRRLGDEQQSPSENERQKRNLDHLKRRSTHA